MVHLDVICDGGVESEVILLLSIIVVCRYGRSLFWSRFSRIDPRGFVSVCFTYEYRMYLP